MKFVFAATLRSYGLKPTPNDLVSIGRFQQYIDRGHRAHVLTLVYTFANSYPSAPIWANWRYARKGFGFRK